MEFKPGNIVKMIDTYWHGSLNESRKDIGKLFVIEYSYGEKYGNGKCYGGYSILSMEKCNKAMFDSRCFNIPKEEVTNYFYWRQLDATRNSIQMVGQANFSHKELQNKSCNDIQNMLLTEKDINWNDLITYKKRGSCCVKKEYAKDDITRTKWVVDKNIPIFKGEDRSYIDDLVFVGE